MVENRPVLAFLTHVILLLGVAIIAFPIWITFVAATHDAIRPFSAAVCRALKPHRFGGCY